MTVKFPTILEDIAILKFTNTPDGYRATWPNGHGFYLINGNELLGYEITNTGQHELILKRTLHDLGWG